jgi:tripartite-type tricarboxylate transporter receptor subunit TctC
MARCALILFFAAFAAAAQDYPARPLTLIVPFAAGGGLDTSARRITAKLSPRLGQQVIVDNRVGAGGTIGSAAAAKAAPDGYTLLFVSISWSMTPALYKDLAYDPVKSFTPVIQTNRGPFVLAVQPALPVKNVKELVAYAQQNPGKLNYGSAGIGSAHHFGSEILRRVLGIEMTHIPYKGAGPGWTALVGGQIQVMFDSMPGAAPSVQGGQSRAIAVTGAKRLSVLPDVPTLQEQGVRGADVDSWFGIVAPAGTPREIIAKLHAELAAVLRDSEVMESFVKMGFEAAPGTPEEFGTLIAQETARYRDAALKAGIKAE